jgi:hypothetical protein
VEHQVVKSLSRIRKRNGRCYELALKAMLDEPGADRFMLAHGRVSMIPNSTRHDCFMDHAWIILDDGRIYDPVLNAYMQRSQFESRYRAELKRSYSKLEAASLCRENKHCGPWH